MLYGQWEISEKTGMRDIEVPCMKCGTAVKATVDPSFNKKLRKFCGLCLKSFGTVGEYFNEAPHGGCRQVGKSF